ncbi:MAG: hypothetical protein RXQ70_05105 [Sulfolobaceae archaeon]|nr:hypothetical protein [Sulfolobales archaeon]
MTKYFSSRSFSLLRGIQTKGLISFSETLKYPIKRVDVFHVLSKGIVVSADIRSKSKKDLTHHVGLVLDPLTLKVVKYSYDYEGYTFRHHYWRIWTLERMIKEDNELRERIGKTRQEITRIEEDCEKEQHTTPVNADPTSPSTCTTDRFSKRGKEHRRKKYYMWYLFSGCFL